MEDNTIFNRCYKTMYYFVGCLMWGTAILSSFVWAIRVETGWGVLVWSIYSFVVLNICAQKTNRFRSDYELKTWGQIFFDSTIDDVVQNRIGYVLYWLSFIPVWGRKVFLNALMIDHEPTLNLFFTRNLPCYVYEEVIPVISQTFKAPKWFALVMEKTNKSSPSTMIPHLYKLLENLSLSTPYQLKKDKIALITMAMERLSQLLPCCSKQDCLNLAKDHSNFLIIDFSPEVSPSSSLSNLQLLHVFRKKIITYTQANEQTLVLALDQLKQKEHIAKEELLTRFPRTRHKIEILEQNVMELASLIEKRLLLDEVKSISSKEQVSPQKRRM